MKYETRPFIVSSETESIAKIDLVKEWRLCRSKNLPSNWNDRS